MMHIKLTPDHLKNGLRHVSYEYVATLAGAFQMTQFHDPPVNLLVQDATLVHIRALAEFFQVDCHDAGFPEALPRERPDLRALFYCGTIGWDGRHFERRSSLMRALDKGLAHISLSRDLEDPDFRMAVAWDGPTHLHGTVHLISTTWAHFNNVVMPAFKAALADHLADAQRRVPFSLADFERRFDDAVCQRGYILSQLP